MENRIDYSSYFGCAAELCSKGDATEFLQPWYTPISTTPENTGMAVGGIGNTFTLTPEGKTPNFSFIPGIFTDCSQQNIHFNDFYLSVMEQPSLDNLQFDSFDDVCLYLDFYPINLGKPMCLGEGEAALLELVKSAICSLSLYQDNQDNFSRWNIDFSDKTKSYIEQQPKALMTQLLVAIDFFDGLLINSSVKKLSLTAKANSQVSSINADAIDYRALYPMAEYAYHGFEDIEVVRKVVSPIVKGHKKLCSLPLHWNHFQFTNHAKKSRVITLVQPLDNIIGGIYQKGREGMQDSQCYLNLNPINQQHQSLKLDDDELLFKGINMASNSSYGADVEGEITFGAVVDKQLLESGKVSVSLKPAVYSSQAQKQVINALNTGRTSFHFDKGIYSGREGQTGLITIQIELAANESVELRLLQLMDFNKISFDGWESEKAYKQFYPQAKPSEKIIEDILPSLADIEKQIVEQQNSFCKQAYEQFQDKQIAEQFSTMAMNTLSFLAESSVWSVDDRFLVKECVDYPFFNSLDVYFYGSFSLMYLLPELDLSVMKDFAKAILASDDTLRRYWKYESKPFAELEDEKYQGIRAIRGAVIHDLGSPFDIQADAYSWHNVKEWKDLAPKYILMVYRHYNYCNDSNVLKECWPAIKESVEFLCELIEPGDSLPLTRGTDDTFDNLASHGISIYCASLWAAGLKAGAVIANLMDEKELAKEYQVLSEKALTTLENALWDEQKGYYHFYATPIQRKHLTGNVSSALQELELQLTGEPLEDMQLLNRYIDEVDHLSDLSKLEQRLAKKRTLMKYAPEIFTKEYIQLQQDSDNSFGDVMLADSYLKLVGLEGLFAVNRVSRALDYIYNTNFLINSPKLGVANMTLANGAPDSAFQAQDVWIGVQFSVATALKMAGKVEQAENLIATVYKALYSYAKIPFAAPEGFNSSVSVSAEMLHQEFDITEQEAQAWFTELTNKECLLSDGRVNPDLSQIPLAFSQKLCGCVNRSYHNQLHQWLINTGLKYTAGRYFRPGMIFAYLYSGGYQ